MLPYYAIIIVGFTLSIVDFIKSKYIRLFLFIVYAAILIFFAGLRSIKTDNDSGSYQEAFQIVQQIEWKDLLKRNYDIEMERGYLILNKIISDLGGDTRTVIFIMALFTGIINFTLIYKKSDFPFSSILFYVSFFYLYRDFTQIRYALAAGIFAWTVFCFIDKKYLLAFLLEALATLFHNSVLIGVPFMILYWLIRNRYFYLIFPFIGLIGIFYSPVSILASIAGLPQQLVRYFTEELGYGGFVVSVVSQVILFLYCIFYSKIITPSLSRAYSILYSAISFASMLNLLFISIAIMQRFSSLLFGLGIFLLPSILKKLEESKVNRNWALVLHFMFNCFFLYYGLKMVSPELVRPYSIE